MVQDALNLLSRRELPGLLKNRLDFLSEPRCVIGYPLFISQARVTVDLVLNDFLFRKHLAVDYFHLKPNYVRSEPHVKTGLESLDHVLKESE